LTGAGDKRRCTRVFGPVPSRRLGLSLGVDPVPLKTCSMDCVYCELGPTTDLTVRRTAFVEPGEVLRDVADRVAACPQLDFITLSGSGEPTLHSGLAEIIAGVRRLTDVPVAVLTNGSLMTDLDVRSALDLADVVLPSLDAVSPEVFRAVNRPHPSLDPAAIAAAIGEFARTSKAAVWLECAFVTDVNDSDCEVRLLRDAIDDIDPERVHVNTVVRPPAVAGTRPVSSDRLARIAEMLGPRAEVIAPPAVVSSREIATDASEIVIAMAARRPVTASDVARSLGTSPANAERILAELVEKNLLTLVRHGEKLYHKA